MVCGVYCVLCVVCCVLCVVYDREKLKGLVVIDNYRYNGSDFCWMRAPILSIVIRPIGFLLEKIGESIL